VYFPQEQSSPVIPLEHWDPQPERPGARIYIPQEQGGPNIPPGTRFPFHRLLRLTGRSGSIGTRLDMGHGAHFPKHCRCMAS
jgi:hypothetical protein